MKSIHAALHLQNPFLVSILAIEKNMFSWASKCLKYHNHIKTLTAINVLRFHLQSDNTVKEPRCLLQSISLNLVATKIYHFSIKAPGPAKAMLWSQGTKLTVARRFAMEMQAVS
jgi:hypothetical protein